MQGAYKSKEITVDIIQNKTTASVISLMIKSVHEQEVAKNIHISTVKDNKLLMKLIWSNACNIMLVKSNKCNWKLEIVWMNLAINHHNWYQWND